MSLQYKRYEEIKKVVADTLRKGKIVKIPICCFQLVKELKIECIPYSTLPLKKQSVCLQLSEEGFTLDGAIYYNDFQIATRIRFTIMHEIGHIMLDHTEDDEIAEQEANFFSAYILVPPVLVYANDKTGDMHQDKIRILFNVSNPVAESTYSYYCKWTKRNSDMFALAETDTKIYNHFFAG